MQTQIIRVQLNNNQFSENEIIQAIPQNKRDLILKEKPLLKAYIISQEGLSNPVELDNTNQYVSKQKSIMKWTSDSINSFYDKLKEGIKFFKNHNQDNSHSNRNAIGEIVGKAQKYINGKLSNIIIGKFNNDFDSNLNTVSFEGVLEYVNNGIEKVVDKVVDITGIALANSNEVNPGFENATQIASVQFNETIIKEETKPKKETKKMFDVNELSENEIQLVIDRASKSQLVNAIQYRKFKPSDLFGEKELAPKVKFSKGKILIDGDEENVLVEKINESIEKHYSNKIQELEKTNIEFQTKLKSFENKERKPSFLKNFNEIIERKQLDELTKEYMTKFVERHIEGLEIPETEQGIYKMVDDVFGKLSEDYKLHAEVFIKNKEEQTTNQPTTKQNLPIGGGTGGKDALDLWLERDKSKD